MSAMSSQATYMQPLPVQVSWDRLDRRACLGFLVDQGCLDSVEVSDQWVIPVCKAGKVRLTQWGSLGLGSLAGIKGFKAGGGLSREPATKRFLVVIVC